MLNAIIKPGKIEKQLITNQRLNWTINHEYKKFNEYELKRYSNTRKLKILISKPTSLNSVNSVTETKWKLDTNAPWTYWEYKHQSTN